MYEMSHKSIFALLFCLPGIFTSPANGGELVNQDATKNDIQFVGSADGKSFFAMNFEAENFLNWTQAESKCLSLNMKLAEITSPAQANALQQNMQAPTFDEWYWTAGRDAQEHRQFTWVNSNIAVSVSGSGIGSFRAATPIQTCLELQVLNKTISFVSQKCNNGNRVLCEMRSLPQS